MADHRIERALERYGVELTKEDVARLEASLSHRTRLRAVENGDEAHIVTHKGTVMVCGARFMFGQMQIRTFLPLDSFTKSARRESRTRLAVERGTYRERSSRQRWAAE